MKAIRALASAALAGLVLVALEPNRFRAGVAPYRHNGWLGSTGVGPLEAWTAKEGTYARSSLRDSAALTLVRDLRNSGPHSAQRVKSATTSSREAQPDPAVTLAARQPICRS